MVYKLDRLSCSVLDTLQLIESFKSTGVAFHSVNEKIDTTTATGKFFLTIITGLAEMERGLISERTSDALQMKKRNHERAGQIPYGWSLAEDGNTLIEDGEETKAIELIKEQKAKEFSLRAICSEFSAKGYRP